MIPAVSPRVRRIALFAALAWLVVTTPAGAATVLADDRFKWFYWFGPLFAFGAIVAIVGLSAGYIKKVLLPKYRGRRPE